jgi:hypothetical protein
VPRDVHRGPQHRRAEHQDHDGDTARVVTKEHFGAAGEADRGGDLVEMMAQQHAVLRREAQRVQAVE